MLKVTEWHWRLGLVCPHKQVPPEFIVFSFLPASTQLKMDLEFSSVPSPSLSFSCFVRPPVWHALTPLYLCLLCFFCVTLCSFSPFLSKAQLFLFIPALWSFSLSSLHQLSTLSFFTLLWSLQPLHFHPYTPTVPSIPMLPCLHPPEAEFSINSIAVYKERKGDGEIKRIKGNNRKRGRKRKLAPHDSNSEGKTMMPVAGKAAIHSLHTTDPTITKSWASHTLNP